MSLVESETLDTKTGRGWRSLPWAVIVCWFSFLSLSTLGVYLLDRRTGYHPYPDIALFSGFIGLVGLASMIGGLTARGWVIGWFIAVLLTCVHTAVVAFVIESTWDGYYQLVAICALWPSLLLFTCAPLVLLRNLWGWTLARQSSPAIPRWQSSVEDLLLTGVVVACSITVIQIFVYTEGANSLPEILFVLSIMGGLALLIVPITVYVTFRARSWPRRLLGWGLLSCFGFLLVAGFILIVESNSPYAFDRFDELLLGVVSCSSVVAIGLTAFLLSGYKLTHFASASRSDSVSTPLPEDQPTAVQAPVTPATQPATQAAGAAWLDDSTDDSARPRWRFTPVWQTRLVAGSMVMIAALASLGLQRHRDWGIQQFKQLALPSVRELTMQNGQIARVHFGKGFELDDLRRIVKDPTALSVLSLAGSRADDQVLSEVAKFPNLIQLDLSGTAITDSGLQANELFSTQSDFPRQQMRRISLADTGISWSAAQQLAKRYQPNQMDLSGLGITDQQLSESIRTMRLKLSRNPITDVGIENLLKQKYWTRLDLSDTQVTGQCFIQYDCPSELILDGLPIDDATLLQIFAKKKPQKISLARTKVTAAILPQLDGMTVRLGQGLITDKDLAALGPIQFAYLALNDKQFTGSGLANTNITVPELDLSGSSVTDDVLATLPLIPSTRFLDLSDTAVTDRCLPLHAYRSDVRGTKLTARGLAEQAGLHRFIISFNQFAPEEMAMLKHLRVTIGDAVMPQDGFE